MRRIERLRRGTVTRLLRDGLIADLRSIEPWLPESATSVLDIGCGLGGIDLLIHRHYAPDSPALTLLDRDGVSQDVYYGYTNDAAHYVSLALTRRFLEENGVPGEAITTWNAGESDYPEDGQFDLIVSLISWGFHYPLDTYLAGVKRTLTRGGTLILDVRAETGAEAALRSLGEVQVVEASRGRKRLCVRRA